MFSSAFSPINYLGMSRRRREIGRKTRFEPTRPLAFMHVPKTAGTALTQALSHTLAPEIPLTGFDRCLFGVFSKFDTFSVIERQRIHTSAVTMCGNSKLILGHFSYSTLRSIYPSAQIITVLREPVARLMSHWVFWRSVTDETLGPLGAWGDSVRESRSSLIHFLSRPQLAPQIDNVTLRMLLWGHPRISADNFIDRSDDSVLLEAARVRMADLAFADIVENRDFATNLTSWLGRPVTVEHVNETIAIPHQFRVPLHKQLTDQAQDLLFARSRLDLQLWKDLVAQVLPDVSCEVLRQRAWLRNFARYGALFAGTAPHN